MKKHILRLLLFSLLLILIPSMVSAEGICELNKYDYSPGETATFICTCTDNNEKNELGFIVWQNSTGDVLRSIPIDSGDCKKNLFGDSYTFSNELSDYLGNATFSLNADGTGIPNDWDDVNDVISDDYNISGAGITDCLIHFEVPPNSTFQLGKWASMGIEVEDGITFDRLIEASCKMHIEKINDVHIIELPTGAEVYGHKSTARGEVAFQRQFDIDTFEPSTTYLAKVYCYCTGNDTERSCYLESTGDPAGFKSCVSEILFSSGSEDYRVVESLNSTLYYVIAVIIIMLIAGLLYAGDKIQLFFVEYKRKVAEKKYELIRVYVDKYILYLSAGWFILPLINVAIKINEVYLLGLTNTLNGLYSAVMWILIAISTLALVFIFIYLFTKLNDYILEKTK